MSSKSPKHKPANSSFAEPPKSRRNVVLAAIVAVIVAAGVVAVMKWPLPTQMGLPDAMAQQ